MHHYRDKDNVEIDAIIEFGDQSIIAREVKSSVAVNSKDIKGLFVPAKQVG